MSLSGTVKHLELSSLKVDRLQADAVAGSGLAPAYVRRSDDDNFDVLAASVASLDFDIINEPERNISVNAAGDQFTINLAGRYTVIITLNAAALVAPAVGARFDIVLLDVGGGTSHETHTKLFEVAATSTIQKTYQLVKTLDLAAGEILSARIDNNQGAGQTIRVTGRQFSVTRAL